MGVNTGIYRGIVTTSSDPLGKGRIKAQVPSVLGPKGETVWASPVGHRYVVVGDTGSGLAGEDIHDHGVNLVATIQPPSPGAGVWIAFESGDLESPLWLGVWR